MNFDFIVRYCAYTHVCKNIFYKFRIKLNETNTSNAKQIPVTTKIYIHFCFAIEVLRIDYVYE